MSDFHQTGVVATFHRLGANDLGRLEGDLVLHANERPIALILPSLYCELKGTALAGIVEKLKKVDYIKDSVITLGNATENEFNHAREFFSKLPQKTKIVWNNGPRLEAIYKTIEDAELPTGEHGKGKAVWMAYGYVLSKQRIRIIALHDCDIVTYDRQMLARLCYPLARPGMDYDFCKGYYSRVTDRMHGRVTRLLVTPLIRALQKMTGYHPFLNFLDSFRYPLAGEFAINVDLAGVIKIPADWGLEMGVLAEVYRNTATRRVCQVDIAENYEHKHQSLSPEDVAQGLNKMSIDISKSLFRTLASEGIVFSHDFFNSLLATYVSMADELLRRYEDDAAVNGLVFDRHAESLAMETFTKGIKTAAEIITDNPIGVPLIPAWHRVISAIPNILDLIEDAVEKDNS
jgi:glucosyl-3-phosphoglycerate synthase